MVKVVDHQQTGKRKFIRGGGRKQDTPLEVFDVKKMDSYSPAQLDKATDRYLKKKDVSAALSVAKGSKNSHKPNWQKKKLKKARQYLTGFKQNYRYLTLSDSDRIRIHEHLESIDNILVKI